MALACGCATGALLVHVQAFALKTGGARPTRAFHSPVIRIATLLGCLQLYRPLPSFAILVKVRNFEPPIL